MPIETPKRITGRYIAKWIQDHFTPYNGDASFLSEATDRTLELNQKVQMLMKERQEKYVPDVEYPTTSGVSEFNPEYLDKELEVVVGLHSDIPLSQSVTPINDYITPTQNQDSLGHTSVEDMSEIFTKYRKSHKDGILSAYTTEMENLKKRWILNGLPDSYNRGRVIGDYRRIALFGVDKLIQSKLEDLETVLDPVELDEKTIQLREEIAEQILGLKEVQSIAQGYGFDITKPASTAREAIQWLYFGFLAAIKEHHNTIMSIGRMDAFLDIFIERDLEEGIITEIEAQELIDQLVLKLRLIPQFRATCVLGGLDSNGKTMVTKTSFRFLKSTYNLGSSPELNFIIAWSPQLGENFKSYCVRISIEKSSIQFENDDLTRARFGSDYYMAPPISALKTGRDVELFGACANLPKLLLCTLNGGRDELSGDQIGPQFLNPELVDGALDYDSLMLVFEEATDWFCEVYVKTMNVIHFMHDKYSYERIEMALHDTMVRRLMVFGIAGLSVLTDSLSAIKYAKVTPVRDAHGLTSDFIIEGEFPKFGNNDPKVDQIAHWIVSTFYQKLCEKYTYRNSIPILSITSNVVYGMHTGDTPDGRKRGSPFAPGANPVQNQDQSGALASLSSVASVPYDACLSGIYNTFSLLPDALGDELEIKIGNLTGLIDGYFLQGGHHISVNIMDKDKLMEAVDRPEKWTNLSTEVSNDVVNLSQLTREQKLEIIAGTFHEIL
eukprot:g7049.t1